ncbi:MAG: adenylate kinase [Pseudomonadota bacterium]
MKRINVVGISGSGKTTFSRALSDALDIAYFQMDQLYWKKDWQEPTDAEFVPKVREVVATDAWVLDGNYHSRTHSIKWQRADTVVWLDYGFITTFLQLLKRSIERAATGEELWPNTGNRESFRKTFFDRSSVLLWFLKCYRQSKRRYRAIMHSNEFPNVRFIRISGRGEAERFLERAWVGEEFGDAKADVSVQRSS